MTKNLISNSRYLAYNPKLKERACEMRNNSTEAEKKLWNEYFKKLDYQFYRQKIINNYIVDFYCPKLKLVIEVDGDQHSEVNNLEYDKERTSILNNYFLTVIRFKNEEISKEFDKVCKKISDYLRIKPPLGERGAGGFLFFLFQTIFELIRFFCVEPKNMIKL